MIPKRKLWDLESDLQSENCKHTFKSWSVVWQYQDYHNLVLGQFHKSTFVRYIYKRHTRSTNDQILCHEEVWVYLYTEYQCCDSAFAHKKELSIFKFPERFLETSCAAISLLLFLFMFDFVDNSNHLNDLITNPAVPFPFNLQGWMPCTISNHKHSHTI